MKKFAFGFAWRSLGLAAAAGVSWAAGCSDSHPGGALSADCTLNTDCTSPLVCAFQRCHQQCTASRDCAPGQRCMSSDRPFHVCQLAAERDCHSKSDCPTGQVCGIDNQCRDECTTASDCVNGQVCTSGTCADPMELTNGTLPNASSQDAAASEGRACRFNSDCPRPLVCRSGACSPECVTTADCPSGLACTDSKCSVPVACSYADGGTDRRAGGPCLYTSQCPAPLSCIQGFCTCECLGTADCERGFACVNNRCESILGGATSAEIGPAGGTITSGDGALVMTLPANAVDHPIVLSVRNASAWPAGAIGTVFEVEPSGTQFKKDVTIELSYAGASLGSLQPRDLSVATAEGATWMPLGTNVVDAKRQTVSSTTPHLSVFGLVAFGRIATDADAGATPAMTADASVSSFGGRGGGAGSGSLGAGGFVDGIGGMTGGSGGFGGRGSGGTGAGGKLPASGGFGGGVAKDAGAVDCTGGCACLNANACGGNICCYQPTNRSSACVLPAVGCSGMVLF